MYSGCVQGCVHGAGMYTGMYTGIDTAFTLLHGSEQTIYAVYAANRVLPRVLKLCRVLPLILGVAVLYRSFTLFMFYVFMCLPGVNGQIRHLQVPETVVATLRTVSHRFCTVLRFMFYVISEHFRTVLSKS